MAMSDPVEPGVNEEVLAATLESAPTSSGATVATPEDTSLPVGHPSGHSPDLESADEAPYPPVSPIALAGHLNLRVHVCDVDTPCPATPPLAPEGGTRTFAAASAQGDEEDASPLIPTWLFDSEAGNGTPGPPAGDSCPATAYASADSPPLRDSPGADCSTGPVLFGRWATVVPVGDVPY